MCQKCAFLLLWDRKVGTKRIDVAMNANLAVLIIRPTFGMLINVFLQNALWFPNILSNFTTKQMIAGHSRRLHKQQPVLSGSMY